MLCLLDFLETLIVFFYLMRSLSKVETRRNSSFATVWSMDLYQCRQFFRVCDCIKIWSWFLTNLIIYRWLPCERPLCVGPLNFWEFGTFSRNFIWSCLYTSPCCVVTCNAAFVLFSPTPLLWQTCPYLELYCRFWCNYLCAWKKNFFPLLCLLDFLETFIVFLPDKSLEQGRNASQ